MAITVRELADAAVAAELIGREDLAALPGWERLPLPDFVEGVTGRGRFPPAALYRAVAERRGLDYVDCEAADPADRRKPARGTAARFALGQAARLERARHALGVPGATVHHGSVQPPTGDVRRGTLASRGGSSTPPCRKSKAIACSNWATLGFPYRL